MQISSSNNALLKTQPVVFAACIADFNMGDLQLMLDALECERMLRFRQDKDRQRYALAHVLKRKVLSAYLAVSPDSIGFALNDHGKPYCLDRRAPQFNISHSGNWVLLAISPFSEVGVDIESRVNVERMGILQRVCGPNELAMLPKQVSERVFLCIWTQKEAVSKACGQGISVGMERIVSSAKLGKYTLTLGSEDYRVWSQVGPDDSVISYAATSENEPIILQVNDIDAQRSVMTCSVFEL